MAKHKKTSLSGKWKSKTPAEKADAFDSSFKDAKSRSQGKHWKDRAIEGRKIGKGPKNGSGKTE